MSDGVVFHAYDAVEVGHVLVVECGPVAVADE